MASYDDGKLQIVDWIQRTFETGSTCLDVGACDGKWRRLVGDHLIMDACEIWEPNIKQYRLEEQYRNVFNCDITKLKYDWYDLIIFGDVIEHIEVQEAQRVLIEAAKKCRDLIIGVPFLYQQGEIYGNPYERHIQDDLTDALFRERYPGFTLLFEARTDYFYYHKDPRGLQPPWSAII